MYNYEGLRKEYLNLLDGKIAEINKKQMELKKNDFIDESNLEKIKLNIIDIFVKMFNVSYNKVCKANNSNANEVYRKLYETYLGYFEKIPAAWREKAEKDKQFNMTKEYVIEEIKIHEMEEIKKSFIEYYNKHLK